MSFVRRKIKILSLIQFLPWVMKCNAKSMKLEWCRTFQSLKKSRMIYRCQNSIMFQIQYKIHLYHQTTPFFGRNINQYITKFMIVVIEWPRFVIELCQQKFLKVILFSYSFAASVIFNLFIWLFKSIYKVFSSRNAWMSFP